MLVDRVLVWEVEVVELVACMESVAVGAVGRLAAGTDLCSVGKIRWAGTVREADTALGD